MGKYAVYDSHEREYPFSSDSYKECNSIGGLDMIDYKKLKDRAGKNSFIRKLKIWRARYGYRNN